MGLNPFAPPGWQMGGGDNPFSGFAGAQLLGGVKNPLKTFGSNLKFWGAADRGLSTDGAALLATASNQYFSLASALVTVAPLTFSIWVKPTNLSQNNGLWCLTVSGSYVGACQISTGGNVQVSFNGFSTFITGATTLSAGTSYNVLITYDGTTCNIYVNGVKDTNSGALANSLGASLNGTVIGSLLASGSPSNSASATVGPFQAWSRILTAPDIATVSAGVLYRGFTSALQTGNVCSIEFTIPGNLGKDNSPNNNTFTPQGAPTYVAGPVTYSPPAGTYLLSAEAASVVGDQSSNANNGTQTTGANRYTLQLNQINGLPALQPNNTAGGYALGSGVVLPGPFAVYVAEKHIAAGNTIPFGNSSLGTLLGFETPNFYAINDAGTNINVSYTPPSTYVNLRVRRDASNVIYLAATGKSEVTIGTLSGTFTLSSLFARLGGSQWSSLLSQFEELFAVNVDPVATGQDAAALAWLKSRTGLTIP